MQRSIIRNSAAALLLLVVLFCMVRVHSSATQRRVLRVDAMELGSITYGLFDPAEWRVIISSILEKKVNEFELTEESREQMRTQLTDLMNRLLTEVEQVMQDRNKQKGFGGLVKNVLMDVLVDVDDIRSGIPRYVELMLDYAADPSNKQEIQCFILDRMNELGERTDGFVDRTAYHEVLVKYEAVDRTAGIALLRARSLDLERLERSYLLVLLLASLGLFTLAAFSPPLQRIPLIATIVAALALLLSGLLLPMIDIEASIAEFSLVLIGEPVVFKDQVLFHQSKSILEVVRVLLTDGDGALSVVALLVFSFSVLIPASKMGLSLIALVRGIEPRGRFVRFLIYHAGKWSMADVMVVAIFMAFIGFNGVVNSQLGDLESYVTSIHVLTTNNSSLEVGFYLFTGYCLLGLGCAVLVRRSLVVPLTDRG
ncbi:MAG: paraquat-inducible protein A [Flavobacteriales bacterium]|nr:paraquat-inducible protein A [Flavobacteriales bacterium]